MPAMFSGCVGFKPTPARVSDQGITMPFEGGKIGMKAVRATAGPLANRVEDLAVVGGEDVVERSICRAVAV